MKRFSRMIKLLTICLCVGIIFVGTGYFYLDKKLSPAENKTESVPYVQSAPESVGVNFLMGGRGILAYMNFSERQLSIVFDDKGISTGGILYGYSVDYTVDSNLDLLAGIIDILGGIELENGDEILRYTGVQISDKLSRDANSGELIRQIIFKIAKKIEETGFPNDVFLYIIENSDTDLTMPICYFWAEYIPLLCRNVQIVN